MKTTSRPRTLRPIVIILLSILPVLIIICISGAIYCDFPHSGDVSVPSQKAAAGAFSPERFSSSNGLMPGPENSRKVSKVIPYVSFAAFIFAIALVITCVVLVVLLLKRPKSETGLFLPLLMPIKTSDFSLLRFIFIPVALFLVVSISIFYVTFFSSRNGTDRRFTQAPACVFPRKAREKSDVLIKAGQELSGAKDVSVAKLVEAVVSDGDKIPVEFEEGKNAGLEPSNKEIAELATSDEEIAKPTASDEEIEKPITLNNVIVLNNGIFESLTYFVDKTNENMWFLRISVKFTKGNKVELIKLLVVKDLGAEFSDLQCEINSNTDGTLDESGDLNYELGLCAAPELPNQISVHLLYKASRHDRTFNFLKNLDDSDAILTFAF